MIIWRGWGILVPIIPVAIRAVLPEANHSLIFVNMEYWAIPLALLFLFALFV